MGQAGLEQPCDCPVQQQDSRASAVRTKGMEEQPGTCDKGGAGLVPAAKGLGRNLRARNRRHATKLQSQASCYKFRKTNFI